MALDSSVLDELTPGAIAPYIQHTLIETGLTYDRIVAHAEEAVKYGFNAAMVPGSWVPEVVQVLRGTGVLVASALDFPSCGVTTSRGKAAEAESLVALGAQQIDIGVQVGWLKSGLYDRYRDDIAGVVAAGVPVKVMLELPLLTADERDAAVELAMEAGAAYLKNASSGAVEVANPALIAYLAGKVQGGVQVKASGSIKSYEQAASLLRAGAVLLGTSAGTSIVAGETGSGSY
ncbi:MAG: deoxyribose-phosphate aldolase [Propionibacteriaceae bacterium]|nr:deoxyribose-phosphate aldolase [Propionibacteriaceae bacterium]